MTNALLPEQPLQRVFSQSTPPRILHVEDDQDFSAALKCRLEAHGVAVVRAFDGLDGIRQSQQHETDAVLLDLELPNANGDKVLIALRKHQNMQQIPVIVLTAQKDRKLRQRMTDLGASAYLTKPLRFDDLRQQLARFIDILPKPSLGW